MFFRYAFQAPVNYYRAIVSHPIEKARTDTIPVCSIFGTGDKYLSVAANKDGKKFVNDFEEYYLEGVSHWAMLESPDQVNKIMENYLKNRKF